MLHTHASTDPKHCGVGLVDEDNMGSVEEVCIGLPAEIGKGGNGMQAGRLPLAMYSRPPPFVHNEPNSSLLPASGKEMRGLDAQKGKKTKDASVRKALVWGHSSGPSREPFVPRALTKGLCPRHI